jgi:hypothetical protein
MSTLKAISTGKFEGSVPETRLWRVVIARTIQEWISGPLSRKRQAELYLFDDTRDFRLVCGFAGIDSGDLRARLALLRCQAIPGLLTAAA